MAATSLSLYADFVTPLQPEGQAVQNGQVGIGLFEQLQANISPEATHLYFIEQLAAGAFNHQDGGGTMGIQTQFWRYGSWMATLSAGNPSAQTGALGPNTNSALYSLLNLQSVGSPELGLVAQNGGAGEQNSTANPATIDLSAEFLSKMSAQSQASGSDNAENTQAAVPANAFSAPFHDYIPTQ